MKRVNIGERIKEIREKLNLQQKDIATSMGITANKLSKIENGIEKKVDIYVVRNFCNIAGITIEEFLNCDIKEFDLELRQLTEKCMRLNKVQLRKLNEFIGSLFENNK